MEPAPRNHLVDVTDRVDESDLQTVIETATNAEAPDYHVQQQTGRVLTRLVLGIGAVQVSGVLLWLVLVFTGTVDASMNLDAFMISQLVVFGASIIVGAMWTVRRLRTLRTEAENLDRGVEGPILKLLLPDAQWTLGPMPLESIADVEPSVATIAETADRHAQIEDGDTSLYVADIRSGDGCCGLLMVATRPRQEEERRLVVEPGDGAAVQHRFAKADEQRVEVSTGDGDFDARFRVVTSDGASIEDAFPEALRTELTNLHEAAARRDGSVSDIAPGTPSSEGDFSLVIDGRVVALIRRSAAPLFPDDDSAADADAQELMASVAELQRALDIVELITRRGRPNSGD